ncbi:unnamed protein product, partial [Ectocarpus sp. 12 AP-2014]
SNGVPEAPLSPAWGVSFDEGYGGGNGREKVGTPDDRGRGAAIAAAKLTPGSIPYFSSFDSGSRHSSDSDSSGGGGGGGGEVVDEAAGEGTRQEEKKEKEEKQME